MKKCPICEAQYAGDMQFCPGDGNKLNVLPVALLYKGQILNTRYVIENALPEEGSWKVYRATEESTKKKFTVKTLPLAEEGEKAYLDLLREHIDKIRQLHHPGLLSVVDSGMVGESFYVVLEYIEGQNLKEIREDKENLSWELLFEAMMQILQSIDFMHRYGILHLGLTPSKILLFLHEGTPQFVKIDPIGRVFLPGSNPPDIYENTVYTAPELSVNMKPEESADIYSLGVIFYEMMAGTLPYLPGLTFYQNVLPEAPSLRRLKPQLKIPRAIEKTILKAIRWLPAERFAKISLWQKALLGKKKIPWLNFFILGGFVGVIALYFLLFVIKPSSVVLPEVAPSVKETKLPHDKLLPTSEESLKAKIDALTNIQKADAKKMCFVPGGNTRVGSLEGDLDEAPIRMVRIASFYIDRTEVTQEQYRLFVESTGHTVPQSWVEGQFPEEKKNHPVVGVTWYDASLYAAWRRQRLPLESEWERAAHAGKGQIWPWGNLFWENLANIHTQALKPVGSYPKGKSPYGVMDLSGNVWEWVQEWYDLEIKKDRIIKGGSYRSWQEQCTTTYRDGFSPESSRNDIGFRCVLEAEKKND